MFLQVELGRFCVEAVCGTSLSLSPLGGRLSGARGSSLGLSCCGPVGLRVSRRAGHFQHLLHLLHLLLPVLNSQFHFTMLLFNIATTGALRYNAPLKIRRQSNSGRILCLKDACSLNTVQTEFAIGGVVGGVGLKSHSVCGSSSLKEEKNIKEAPNFHHDIMTRSQIRDAFVSQKWMNFRKSSKRPLTYSPRPCFRIFRFRFSKKKMVFACCVHVFTPFPSKFFQIGTDPLPPQSFSGICLFLGVEASLMLKFG